MTFFRKKLAVKELNKNQKCYCFLTLKLVAILQTYVLALLHFHETNILLERLCGQLKNNIASLVSLDVIGFLPGTEVFIIRNLELILVIVSTVSGLMAENVDSVYLASTNAVWMKFRIPTGGFRSRFK